MRNYFASTLYEARDYSNVIPFSLRIGCVVLIFQDTVDGQRTEYLRQLVYSSSSRMRHIYSIFYLIIPPLAKRLPSVALVLPKDILGYKADPILRVSAREVAPSRAVGV